MIPALETARLILRGVTAADAPDLQRHVDDYEVIRTLDLRVPWPYPEDGARHFVDSVLPEQGRDRWVWALRLKAAPDEAIGILDLRRGAGSNRGFWLGRCFWGQGLMSEACDAVTDYAFGTLGFERLIFVNAAGNARSRRIKEKAGAVLLRTEPGLFADPALTKQEVWELTRATWAARVV